MLLWNRICNLAAIAALLMLFSGCGGLPESGSAEVTFTANGVVITHVGQSDVSEVIIQGDGQTIHTEAISRMGSLALPFAWKPGIEYTLSTDKFNIKAIAPLKPSIALLGSVDFGEGLLTLKAGEQASNASSLAISPTGEVAAIGTDDGEILLLSLNSGSILDRKKRSGSYIRSMEFTSNSNLVVGEQAPAGNIISYDISSSKLEERWRYEAGDLVGRGTYDESDPYSWAHQPGIYRLKIEETNSVFALASYSPYVDGQRQARWAVIRLNAETGKPEWHFESKEEMAGVATWFELDDRSSRIAVCIGLDSGEGSLVLLDANNGSMISSSLIQPLKPHVSTVSFWQGVSISGAGETVYAITNDGRALIWNPGSTVESVVLGQPILADDFPVLISGVGVVTGTETAYFITGTTYIPWEVSSGEKVPQIHHAANTVFTLNQDNEVAWSVPIPNLCQGYVMDNSRNWLLASFASNPVYSPESGAGLAIVSVGDGHGELSAVYSINGTVAPGSPVYAAKNGVILLVENPQRSTDGERLEGESRAHVLFW